MMNDESGIPVLHSGFFEKENGIRFSDLELDEIIGQVIEIARKRA